MEDETGRSGREEVVESDSERRRRRRRTRRRKKGKEPNVELQRLWFLARWGIGGLAMLATFAYGIYVTPVLGWGALVFFPAGIVGMICISYALAVPFITALAMVLAFLSQIDSGPLVGLRRAGMAFGGVGALNAVWQIFVFYMRKREVTRNEAGFK